MSEPCTVEAMTTKCCSGAIRQTPWHLGRTSTQVQPVAITGKRTCTHVRMQRLAVAVWHKGGFLKLGVCLFLRDQPCHCHPQYETHVKESESKDLKESEGKDLREV